MLIQPSQPEVTNLPYPTQRLWNDSGLLTPSLGCASCKDKRTCGGLSVSAAVYDCLSFCCQNAADCDTVCRNKPDEFAARVREVGGFGLENVPRAAALLTPDLPPGVPVIFHGNKRSAKFSGPGTVCLPLYRLVEARSGRVRYTDAQQLTDAFGLKPGTQVILTGTSTDPALERWWLFGSDRVEAIRALKKLNIALITTPNYSLFTDQPRWDDLHSMKRIALVHQEFLNEGMPAALHVNARTERDWERWREFIVGRPEITDLAFEFATGAGWAGRLDWHAEQLSHLAAAVPHPLHLVVRGGISILPRLIAAFHRVTCLETSTFVKTMRRKAATVKADGAVRWKHAPTERSEQLDALLHDNWTLIAKIYNPIMSAPRKVA
jgi:hypothetical protein